MRRTLTFRETISRQADDARREMVRTGKLLPENEFLSLLGVGERQLARMVAAGSVFSMEVDGVRYFPAALGESVHDLKRLHSVCRILVPAPPECRLHYLESKQGNLGDISPLKALNDNKLYRLMRKMARAWAAEWSRTVVKIYIGSYLEEPTDVEPVYTAADEVDPRINLWKRAAGAMQAGGYIAPPGPYPRMETATVFISQSPSGNHPDVLEARLALRVTGKRARVDVLTRDVCRCELLVRISNIDNVVDVLLRSVDAIQGAKRATLDEDDRELTSEVAARLLHVSRTHLNALVESGKLEIVRRTAKGHRRFSRAAVFAYKEASKRRQAKGLRKMMAATQRLGLYDDELERLPAVKKK